MSTKEEVLKKLIDSNDYVSGEMLAKEIGVSRASVWKAIKTLQKAGYDIEGVTKCGYKLNQNNKIVWMCRILNLLIQLIHIAKDFWLMEKAANF